VHKSFLHIVQLGSILLKGLIELKEWIYCLIVDHCVIEVCNLDIECNWHVVPGVFFVQLWVPLNHLKKIKLLGELLVALEVIHHLFAQNFICLVFWRINLVASTKSGPLLFSWILGGLWAIAKNLKINTVRSRLPFHIEHWVHWLNFDPPGPTQHCLSNQPGIVSIGHNKLVAVFNIGILKWNFRFLPLASSLIGTAYFNQFGLLFKNLFGRILNEATYR